MIRRIVGATCCLGGILATYESPIVRLSDGTKLKGDTVGNVSSFKGVPFAQPPVGHLRWAPPTKWINDNPNEVIDATAYGSPCKQHYFDGVEMGSEDCLYLNVWSDLNKQNKAPTPVAVYIHGGSYMSGAGSDVDGADFIEYWQGNAIVVSMNYRLNVFGFSGSEDLRAQDVTDSSTGNYGLQDQRMAMEWVRSNIGAFGGDPDRVMIFGESAGAGSVSNHLVMSKSFQYFSSAILESGSFVLWVTQPLANAQTAYDTLASSVSCREASPLHCMLNKSTEEIYQASLLIHSTNIGYGTPYNPTADGVELMTHPWLAAAEGSVADVPILHGTNLDEGSMFIPLSYTATEDDLIAYWRIYYPTDHEIQTLLDFYVTGKDDSYYPAVSIDGQQLSLFWWAGQRSLADASFYCAAKHTSRVLATQQGEKRRASSTYLYHFDYLADGSYVPFVQHTNEIPFAFHNNSYMMSKEDMRMADVMAGYWGAFMTTHDPNSKIPVDLHEWPAYDATRDNLLMLTNSEEINVITGLNEEICRFMNAHADLQIKRNF